MVDKLLVCTDLDRTLIPNGPQSESQGARKHFTTLINRPEVTLTYVSGRHRKLIEKAIAHYNLPQPDFVVGDVGTSIYHVGTEQDWQRQTAWEKEIARDWGNKSHADLKNLLLGIQELRLQQHTKQNRYKLSYYVPLQSEQAILSAQIRERLSRENVRASLIWSVDEPNGIGLLDILPERATKFHAVEALMKEHNFDLGNTVFCGDSGNDIEVMASAIPAVLVANSLPDVKQLARELADTNGFAEQLYVAQGNFMGMNGNYAAGMLEGIAHYYPETVDWMGFDDQRSECS
jgi:sucrose-6F-phosphate phosphohydrolase